MKAILVLDMPDSCRECYLRSLADDCQVVGRYVQEYREQKNKPDWCPLQKLPDEKTGTAYLDEQFQHPAFNVGWNACLDELVEYSRRNKEISK